jgi:predicted AAA+ superfamily ATPase
MISRRVLKSVEEALALQPAVALLGPRQVGKTTLARQIADSRPSIYLDLESPPDRAKLQDAGSFLRANSERLVVLDEIHRAPGLFLELRGVIDDYRRQGMRAGKFLILGSASLDLLRQSGETLAGRIAYIDMGPFDALETAGDQRSLDRLWIRGGFPESFLSPSDAASLAWRGDLIRTYLEREVALFGPRIPSETLRRLWTMLAHNQAALLNASQISASLSVSAQTVTRYIDLLCDLLLVRRLTPIHPNVGKRLVKAPKVYVRDSGLLHELLGIGDYNALAGHPIRGASWEGFVIENLIAVLRGRTIPGFYRTAAGAEIDLILERPSRGPIAIEIKSGAVPSVAKGVHMAIADLKPAASFVVYAGEERYPIGAGIEAIGLRELMTLLDADKV